MSIAAARDRLSGAARAPSRLPNAGRGALLQIACWLAASCLDVGLSYAEVLPRAPELAAPAGRRGLDLSIAYWAPEECPTGAEFLDALGAHLAAGGEGAVDVSVQIARADEDSFELSLRLRVGDQETESIVRADSCAALVQLAALNTGMARTRVSLQPRRDASAPPDPSLGSASLGGASLGGASLAAASSRSGTAPDEPGQPGIHVAPAPDEPPSDDTSETARASVLRPFALGHVEAGRGMLPGTSFGRGIAAGLEYEPWSVRLALTFWVPREPSFAVGGSWSLPLEFERQSIELSPCALHALSPLVSVEGCISLAAQRIRTSAEPPRWVASLGAGAGVVVSPWRGLRLEAQAGLDVVPSPPRFAVSVLRTVYQSEALQPMARAALGWEFGNP